MALQKSYSTNWGLSFPEAYFRITGYSVNIDAQRISIWVSVYKDSTFRAANASFSSKEFEVPSDRFEEYFSSTILKNEGIEFRIKAYEFLKSLEEFSGAIDV